MTTKEKIKFLSLCEFCDSIDENQMKIIRRLSFDSNSFVKVMVASVLVNNVSEESKNILLRLSADIKDDIRLEAYDSLSVFISEEIADFLEDRIKLEKSDNALSYAITSYADICKNLEVDLKHRLIFLEKTKPLLKCDSCILSLYYALFLLGGKCDISDILSFLYNSDYHIVCQTVSVLKDIVNSSNALSIKTELEAAHEKQKTIAAKDNMALLIEFIDKEYLENSN